MTKTPIRWIVNTEPLNSWDALKAIAVICMVIDHAGALLFPDQTWMRIIGRAAMPIFLFLTGFAPHYRWSWAILAAALIVTGSEVWHGKALLPLDILFTILLARGLLALMEKGKIPTREIWVWPFLGFLLYPSIFIIDYGTPALLFAVFGFMQRHRAEYSAKLRASFLALSALISIVIFGVSFEFDTVHMIGNAIIVALTCVALYRFRIKPIHLPTGAREITWALSRLALYIFVIHLVVFRAL